MKPRVLVVDDSAFARALLARLIGASGDLEVAGTARDGDDALAKIAALDPDLVTLDLTMPRLDGIGVLRALAGRPRPRVIVVSISTIDSALGAEALTLGAIDLISKPTALASTRLEEIGDELIARLRAAAPAAAASLAAAAPPPHPGAPAPARGVELVMIGTSTGGPQALTRVIAGLPASLAAPLAIALHIPAGFTEALAARLDRISKLRVVEASDDLVLGPGLVVLARGGSHLRIHRRGGALCAEVSVAPPRPFRPSVDELFASGARAVGARALGVVLTGMGDDGLLGARAIADAGGALITEAAATSIVYGMPRCVQEAGLGATSLLLDDIPQEIARRV